MKRISLILLLSLLTFSAAGSALPVEGAVYLKDGRTIVYEGSDRLIVPRKSGRLKCTRDHYSKRRTKESWDFDSIDSVVVWHPGAPHSRHKFIPLKESGWSWVYVETPCIRVYIYAAYGYSINSRGGIAPQKVVRDFGISSKLNILLQKSRDEKPYSLGDLTHRSNDSFRERICRYIADDPVLCEAIRRSSALRSKTVAMLAGYDPHREENR